MTTCIDHNDGPDNYPAWHAWAEQKAKTHRQSRCDECGLWAIWTRRAVASGESPQ